MVDIRGGGLAMSQLYSSRLELRLILMGSSSSCALRSTCRSTRRFRRRAQHRGRDRLVGGASVPVRSTGSKFARPSKTRGRMSLWRAASASASRRCAHAVADRPWRAPRRRAARSTASSSMVKSGTSLCCAANSMPPLGRSMPDKSPIPRHDCSILQTPSRWMVGAPKKAR